MKATKSLRFAWLAALALCVALPACDKEKEKETKEKEETEEEEETEESEEETKVAEDTTTTTKYIPCRTGGTCESGICCVGGGVAYCAANRGGCFSSAHRIACTSNAQCGSGARCIASGVAGVKACTRDRPECTSASECAAKTGHTVACAGGTCVYTKEEDKAAPPPSSTAPAKLKLPKLRLPKTKGK